MIFNNLSSVSYASIFRISLPIIGSSLSVLFIGLVDLYFVGRLSAAAIMATSIGVSVWWTIAYFFDGIRSSMAVMVSSKMGRNSPELLQGLLNSGIFLATTSGLIFAILSPQIASFTANFVSCDAEVITLSEQFLKILLPCAPLCFIMFAVEGFFRGIGEPFVATILSGVVLIVSIILDVLLINGRLGFSPMGALGAAWATSIAHAIGGIGSILFILFRKKSKIHIAPFAGFLGFFRKFAKSSFDVGLYSGSVNLAMLLFTAFLKKSGTVVQAAHQVAYEIFNIAFLLPMAFMVTASILVGFFIGRNDYDFAKESFTKILKFALILTGFVSIFTFVFASNLANFFAESDAEVVALATLAIKIITINQLLSAIALCLRGALIGLGCTSFVRYIGLAIPVVVFIPLSYLFIVVLNGGIIGGYIALTTWTFVTCLAFGPKLYLEFKKHCD